MIFESISSQLPSMRKFESYGHEKSGIFRSRQELSKEYLIAVISVGTAENGPLKVFDQNGCPGDDESS